MSAASTDEPGSAGGPGSAGRILIIKLGAFGDLVISLAACQAIRRHHAGEHIVLLTTPAYRRLAEASGCFDEVWAVPRPLWWRPWETWALARRVRGGGFARVYDLQWNRLSQALFRALGPARPEWVGVAPGCSHFYPDRRAAKHIAERQAEMLALAGIEVPPVADLGFLTAELPDSLRPPYALVVPGSAPNHLAKRWPLDSYAELCRCLAAGGLQPVLVCGPAEQEMVPAIHQACPQALYFKSGWAEIATLARGAALAVGNDTGPMHLIAAAGCPCIALFGSASDPEKTRPLGRTRVLRANAIEEIALAEVMQAVEQLQDRQAEESRPCPIPPGTEIA